MIVRRITFDRMARKRGSFFLPFVIALITFFITLLGSFIYGAAHLDQAQLKKTLYGELAQYGFFYIDVGESSSERMQEFYENVLKLPIIEGLGSYSIGGEMAYEEERLADSDGIWNAVNEVQRANGLEAMEYGSIQTVDINTGALMLFNIQFEKKLSDEDMAAITKEKGEVSWFCLGHDFSQLEPGSSFTTETGTYCLYGILEENTYIAEEDLLDMVESGNVGGNVRKLDYYMVMLVDDRWISNQWIYLVTDGTTIEEAEKEIQALADEMGMSLMLGRTKDVFEKRTSAVNRVTSLLEVFCAICMIMAVIIMMSSQCIVILQETKVLGILISCGVRKSQIYLSFVLENLFKIVLPMLLTVGYSYLMVNAYIVSYSLSGVTAAYMWRVERQCCIPALLGVGAVIVLLSSAFPVLILKRAMPNRLMKGEL